MIQELYVALLEAGVDEDKARRAADAVALVNRDMHASILSGFARQEMLLKAQVRRSWFIMIAQLNIVALQAFQIITSFQIVGGLGGQ